MNKTSKAKKFFSVDQSIGKVQGIVMPVLMGSLIGASAEIMKWFDYSGYFYAGIWGITTLSLLFWMLFGENIANKIKRADKQL